ncbi:MAG: YDG domain-containing protein [Lachnospiraceae bacterium]|nr:YDG domain-containing protein [Lachnospiraceae bacterium]
MKKIRKSKISGNMKKINAFIISGALATAIGVTAPVMAQDNQKNVNDGVESPEHVISNAEYISYSMDYRLNYQNGIFVLLGKGALDSFEVKGFTKENGEYVANKAEVTNGKETVTFEGVDTDRIKMAYAKDVGYYMYADGENKEVKVTVEYKSWYIEHLKLTDETNTVEKNEYSVTDGSDMILSTTASHVRKIQYDVANPPYNIGDDNRIQIENPTDTVYNGKEHKITVKDVRRKKELTEGTDYELSYELYGSAVSECKNAGSYKVKVIGKGLYAGENETEYWITPKQLEVNGEYKVLDKMYDGKTDAQIDTGIFTLGGIIPGEESGVELDYNANFKNSEVGNNKDVVVSLLSLKGDKSQNYAIGSVNGDKNKEQHLTGNILQSTFVFHDIAPGTYTGDVNNPSVVITSPSNITIGKNTDYTLTYTQNGKPVNECIDVGEYTVTATGIGNYTGTVSKIYTINKADVTAENISVKDKPYDGNTDAELELNKITLSGVYSGDGINVTGSASFDSAETGNDKNVTVNLELTGTRAFNYNLINKTTNVNANITPASFKVSVAGNNTTYNGSTQNPTVTVIDAVRGNVLRKDTDYEVTYSVNGKSVNECKDAGTYTVTVTGKGNYGGSFNSTYTINKKQVTVLGIQAKNKIYDGNTDAELDFGSAHIDGKTETDNIILSAVGTFDSAEVGMNKHVNIKDISLSGPSADNYSLAPTGQQEYALATINKKAITDDLSTYEINVTPESGLYNGNAQNPTVTVTDKETGKTLLQGTDYDISYTLNGQTVRECKETGEYTVKVTGRGNYDGVVDRKYTIAKRSLDDFHVVAVPGNIYNGSVQNPEIITVSAVETGMALTEGTDYEINYALNGKNISECRNAGEYTVTITGKGNYTGTINTSYTIFKKPITISGINAKDKVYDGNTDAELDFGDADISGKVDTDNLEISAVGTFDSEYAGENKYVNITNLSISGTDADNYYLAETGNQEYTLAAINKKAITDDLSAYEIDVTLSNAYNGSIQNPTVVLSDEETGKTLESGTDYEVSYTLNGKRVNDCKDAGEYTVTITGIGNYDGSFDRVYTITESPNSDIDVDDNNGESDSKNPENNGTASNTSDGSISGKDNPKTGDGVVKAWPIFGIFVSVATLLASFVIRRKSKEKSDK